MTFRSTVKKAIPKDVFPKIEPYGHLGEAVLFNTISGFPARRMKIIGVTGTNGKTTTCYLIHRMLREAGYNVGLMTTVAYGVNDDIRPQKYHMTNVTVPALMKRLKFMRDSGVEWLVLETTSQALAQNRVWGVPYSVGVMTNITHEHLDWHGTFEKYRNAKLKLFRLVNKNKRGLQIGIANADDPSGQLFASAVKNPTTYGVKDGNLQARNVKLTPSGSTFNAVIDGDSYDITCHLPGSFNVSNSLATVAVGRAIGLSKKQIEQGIYALQGVEGRMTRINEGQDFDVIVDYAHSPDSFEKLLKDLKPVVKGKLIVMFGSAGRRDEAKRITQGELAGKYADEVVVTEEDDRDMDGLAIMNEIAAGAESAGKTRDKDLFLVHDRVEAINFAVQRAQKGDTVLLLGKGHEKDILRNGPKAAELRHLQQDDHNSDRVVEFPWDEIGTAHAAVKARS